MSVSTWISDLQTEIDELEVKQNEGRARDAEIVAKAEAEGRSTGWCELRAFDPRYSNWRVDTSKLERDLKEARRGWCKYDLNWLTGDDSLTESHRQTWRKCIRQMAVDGLIERDGTFLRLTPKGWSAAEQLAECEVAQ